MSALDYFLFDTLVSSEWVHLIKSYIKSLINYWVMDEYIELLIFTIFAKLVSSEWVHWVIYIYNLC